VDNNNVFDKMWIKTISLDDKLMLMFTPIQTYCEEGVTVRYKVDDKNNIFIYGIEQEETRETP